MGTVEKKRFYRKHIKIYEKLVMKYVAAVTFHTSYDPYIAQRIMHRAFLEVEQVGADSDILNWLYIMASDEIIKSYRMHKKQSFDYSDVKDVTDSHIVTNWLMRETDKTIFKKLNTLPFKNKLIILMRYMAKLEKSDISRLISIGNDKVEPAIHDSLIKLFSTFDSYSELSEKKVDNTIAEELSLQEQTLNYKLNLRVSYRYINSLLFGTQNIDYSFLYDGTLSEYEGKVWQYLSFNGLNRFNKVINKLAEQHRDAFVISEEYTLTEKERDEIHAILEEFQARIQKGETPEHSVPIKMKVKEKVKEDAIAYGLVAVNDKGKFNDRADDEIEGLLNER